MVSYRSVVAMADALLSEPDHRAIVAHYAAVAPLLVRQFGAIPIAWVNFPKGFGDRGVFHKDATDVPASVATVAVETSTGRHPYVALAENALLWLVHAKYAVEFISWTPAAADLAKPAFGHVTLEPSGSASEDDVRAAAVKLRAYFRARGVDPICMLDGFRGITLWFAAGRVATYDDLAAFAHLVVEDAVGAEPDVFTNAALRAERGDRISLGVKSNHPGMGVLLPYAVRGTPGLEVAWPIAWERLRYARNGDVRVENFAETLAREGDVFAALASAQSSNVAPIVSLAERVRLDAALVADPSTGAGGTPPHAFILRAALVVLADGKAHAAAEIRDTAVARGILPASTTAKYVYTALHEYVMRTIGAGRKPPFVQVERAATFRLNRPVDAWPDVRLAALPRWLDDSTIAEFVGRLTSTSTGGDPAAFEVAVCDAFAALGFLAQHVGGEGEPDGIVDAPLAELGWRGILECKTASPGGIVANPRPEEPAKFRDAYGTARAALVGPAFSNDASFLDELQVHKVSLWTTDDLATALREQIGPDELTAAFEPGAAADAIGAILWERAHGERKRVAVTAQTILERAWAAQLRMAHANAPAASPRFTEDALRLLVDETLGAVDPTIFVTSGTIDAAIANLEASGAVKTLGGMPQDSIVVRVPVRFDEPKIAQSVEEDGE